MAVLYETKYTRIASTKHGVFCFYRDDNPIGSCLEYFGEWAEQEFDVISKLVRPDSNCMDIGANIGTHTVALSKMCPGGIVFSFEPQFFISQILGTNLILNDCINVIPHNVGISNDVETISVSATPPKSSGIRNYGEFNLAKAQGDGIDVRCVKLDDVELFGKKVDFIKMDVEEHEVSALLSGHSMIMRDRPSMYIEFNMHKGNDDLLRLLDELGYNSYWHMYTKFNPDNFNGVTDIWCHPDSPHTEKFICSRYETNLVAIPKESDQGLFNEKIEVGDNIVSYLLRKGLIL